MKLKKNQKRQRKNDAEHTDDEDSNERDHENDQGDGDDDYDDDDDDDKDEELNEKKQNEEDNCYKAQEKQEESDTNEEKELKKLKTTETQNESKSHQLNSNEMNNKFLSIANNNITNKSKSPSPTSFNICNILGESSDVSKSTSVNSCETETAKTILSSPLNRTEQKQEQAQSESSIVKSNESITNSSSHEEKNILPPPPPPPLPLSTLSEPERSKTPQCEANNEKRIAPNTPNLDLTPQLGENSNMSFDDTSMTSDEPSSPKLSSSQSQSKSSTSHNADILAKLVDMNTTDEVVLSQRKEFVNKLQKIWEDYGIQCRSLPNVSKQQLDLYKLYIMVKEKGGFNEVTKNKTWKDIALSLNIGASASAAFNVRKKYVSLGIFHFECKYDLNGTDPLPIIAEMEKAAAATKKPKANSNNNNNNSNDSFNRPSTPSTPSSSVSNSNLTNSAKKKKKDKNQANTNQTSTQSPSTMNQPNVPNMNNQQNQMGMQNNQMHAPGLHYQNDYHHQQQQQQIHQIPNQQYPQYANQQYYGQPRPAYNAYQIPPNQVAPTHQMGMQPPQPNQMAANQQFMNQTQAQAGMMNYHQQPPQPGQQQPQPIQRIYNDMYNSPQSQQQQQQQQQQAPQPTPFNQAVRYPAPTQASSQTFAPNGQPQPQQMLHPNYQTYNQHSTPFQQQPQLQPTQQSQQTQQQPQQYPQTGNTQVPSVMINSQSAQPNAPTQQVPHAIQSQQTSLNNNFNQQAGVGQLAASATLNRTPSVDDKSHLSQSSGSQMNKMQNGPQTPVRNSLNQGQHHAHHGHHGHHSQHGHHNHHHHSHHVKPQTPNPTQMMMAQQKKEITFPPDSVEAVQIVENKKRKITSRDLGPLDPWKLFMSLKSGLLAESTWALDALNILLYDDNTISYFHLKHFPGLLNILLEHYLKCLKMIFDDSKSSQEFADLHLNNDSESIESDDVEEHANTTKQSSEISFTNKISQDIKSVDEEKQSSTANKKQVNGYNKKNAKRSHHHHHHHNNNNHVDNHDEDDANKSENENNIDKFKVLKLRLTDRDTRKRYFHFYRTVKFSDANVLEYLYDYNTYLIENLDKPNLKRYRRNADIKKKQEFSEHILTNFNTNDYIETLEKLFYGRIYTQRVEFYAVNDSHEMLEEHLELDSNKESQKQESKEKSCLNDNEEFIRRHRFKSNDAQTKSTSSSNTAYEDRVQSEEESLFRIINQRRTELLNRCICISTIIRNLSFVPGNDAEICKNELLMKIIARLLVLKHTHKITVNQHEKSEHLNDGRHVDQQSTESMNNSDYSIDEDFDDDVEFDCIRKVANKKLFFEISSKPREKRSELQPSANETSRKTDPDNWWWECVHALRENALVTVANVASSINLNNFNEDFIELFVHSLIHWSICKSFDAQDTLCTMSETSLLSAQRLAIETLSKMTITETNIDFFLVTLCSLRPYLEAFLHLLGAEWLTRRDDQTLREFAIVLLTAIAKGDQIAARLIAKYCSFLIAFIEDFEEHTRRNPALIMNNNFNPNNINNNGNNSNSNSNYSDSYSNLIEDNLGTTVDTLRKCSNCILYLSMDSENIALIMKHESRLLDLITSQFVDYKVSQTLAEVLFYCSSSTK
jgi:AT-rich interactive domain-containing protein 1